MRSAVDARPRRAASTGPLRRALRGLALAAACWAASAGALELTEREAAGRRIFHEGLGASGAPVSARLGTAGVPMPAPVVRCANCHGADGRGRAEGGLRPPDITWRRLGASHAPRTESGRERPAYDEAAFARAVTEGVDSAGRRLDPAMPRFALSMRELQDLAAYLARIDEDRDPGLLPDRLRIGTLVPESGPLAPAGAVVVATLRGFVEEINAGGGVHGRRLELVTADAGGDRAAAEAALRRLADEGEVFALAAVFAPALDERFGELVDGARIPAVGAPGQFADASQARYVFDPGGGLREQMLALAEFAAGLPQAGERPAAVVFPDEAPSRDIASALAERIGRHGAPVQMQPYAPGRPDAGALAERLAAEGAESVFFLGRSEDFSTLAQALGAQLPQARLFAASSQAGAAAPGIPPALSGRVFLAYPTLPADWTADGRALLDAVRRRSGLDARHTPLQLRTLAAAQVLVEGLKRAGRDASRERLVAVLEQLYDYRSGLGPPLAFGPGRRIGAPGAHIVAVEAGPSAFRPTGRYVRTDRPAHQGAAP